MRYPVLRCTAAGLLTTLAISGLAAGSARAQQPDATTIAVAVAVAQGNAQSIADGFLAQQKISPQTSSAVKDSADFQDLMNAYIADRGGCSALVDALQR